TYEEALVFDKPTEQEGICLEAPQHATIRLGDKTRVAVQIQDVPHVRVQGLRLSAPAVGTAGFPPSGLVSRSDRTRPRGGSAWASAAIAAQRQRESRGELGCGCRGAARAGARHVAPGRRA